MAVLVTGGAGYIGSHTIMELLENNEELVVLDNLDKGHKQAVLGGIFYHGDLRDDGFMDKVFRKNDIESVVHFAAYSIVGESIINPADYYNNNVVSTLGLLTKMKEYGVRKIVFSSTAAVYGEPERIPVKETDKVMPSNPYGQTKLSIEKALQWFDAAYGIKYISLRYFNAAGAHISGKIGEDHSPETHLIPIIIQSANGRRGIIKIYGDDYSTPDGTCIRDYIHVTDLANAHIAALNSLRNGGKSNIYNLGNGKGFSVKEVLTAAEEVIGKKLEYDIAARRTGDPAVLVASSEKIMKELGWKPRYDKLETIIDTAWRWHKAYPDGFKEGGKQ